MSWILKHCSMTLHELISPAFTTDINFHCSSRALVNLPVREHAILQSRPDHRFDAAPSWNKAKGRDLVVWPVGPPVC